MNLREFITLIRRRWVTVLATASLVLLGVVVYTLAQTPLYQATTRLFVSNPVAASASDLYQGNRLSQERVLSYTQLITGETLADRTIERLNLNMTASTLRSHITAKSKPNTVLIEVSVLDESPLQARDIANALSDEFVVMARELETPSTGAPPDARVVIEQRAKVPTSPVIPKTTRNYAVGLFLGILLGIGLAVVRELLDNTVKDKDTVEELTGTGVAGLVPYDKNRRVDPAISFESDSSATAEAYRKLRTNLQFLAVDNPPRLIVVTSSVPNEGKTTSSINIALALAEADHSVLLVDGDMRRPSVANYLELVGSSGFSTVLSGGAPLDEVLQPTRYPRLTVLGSGPIPPNPSELLGTMAARKALQEMKSKFDYVIVDSPPLLAVTDSAILAAESDGALVLVRAGSTKRDQLTHATEILRDVGAALLGTILTMVPTRGGGSYAHSYYYSHSYNSRDGEIGGQKLRRPAWSLRRAVNQIRGGS